MAQNLPEDRYLRHYLTTRYVVVTPYDTIGITFSINHVYKKLNSNCIGPEKISEKSKVCIFQGKVLFCFEDQFNTQQIWVLVK